MGISATIDITKTNRRRIRVVNNVVEQKKG